MGKERNDRLINTTNSSKDNASEIVKNTQDEIAKTINQPTIKSDDENFIPIYGENPTPESVLKILKERSTAYKDVKNYDEAMVLLEKNNQELFHRLERKAGKNSPLPEKFKIPDEEVEDKIRSKQRQITPANEAEVDKFLAEK